MSSGKQLSFQYGEVSEDLRYKSDASFYSQALFKAFNGVVKKAGGFMNRPGTLYFTTPTNQKSIPKKGRNVGVRIFSFQDTEKKIFTIEVADEIEGTPPSPVFPYTPPSPIKVYNDKGIEVAVYNPFSFTVPTAAIKLNLKGLAISNISADTISLTFNDGTAWILLYDNTPAATFPFLIYLPFPLVQAKGASDPLVPGVVGFNGQPPVNLPVCYLVTQEWDDGTEVFWHSFCMNAWHPHSQLSSAFQVDPKPLQGVKQYNVYRSDGIVIETTVVTTATIVDNARGGHYSLVGRVPPGIKGPFRDYVVTPDITVQPPLDLYLYPAFTGVLSPIAAETSSVRRLVMYKERTILAYRKVPADVLNPFAVDKYIEGQLGASKLGAPMMFGRPLTPNLVDAFSFTIPSNKLQVITQMLALNRLLVFTASNTFIIKGGEQGVLTSQTVNPEEIFHEGSSDEVTPVASGTNGFFVTADKSKLISINYQSDDIGVTVTDISTLSSHLFQNRDVRSLAVTTNNEQIIWVLKKDGTLISLSLSSDGNLRGFSRHETEGYIEDICTQKFYEGLYEGDKGDVLVDGLLMSVIRSGIRYYERMTIRDDLNSHRYMFADGGFAFGTYANTGVQPINISAASYERGQPLTLTRIAGPNFDVTWVDRRIDFQYSELNIDTGETLARKIRLIITSFTNANTLVAISEEDDIPIDLQDAATSGKPAQDILEIQNSWLPTVKQIINLTWLANKKVSVFADGELISSPLNAEYEELIVSGAGTLDLPNWYNWGYVGLPYEFEMETLDLEASDARTFTDKGKNIGNAGVAVSKTIGGLIGQRSNVQKVIYEKLTTRETYGNLTPTEASNGVKNVPFPSSWNNDGRVVVRQVDPLPITVLAIYPKGVIGD